MLRRVRFPSARVTNCRPRACKLCKLATGNILEIGVGPRIATVVRKPVNFSVLFNLSYYLSTTPHVDVQVTGVVEESQEWEGDLVFTVRSQKLREPDRLGQVSLRHALEVEILKIAGRGKSEVYKTNL